MRTLARFPEGQHPIVEGNRRFGSLILMEYQQIKRSVGYLVKQVEIACL